MGDQKLPSDSRGQVGIGEERRGVGRQVVYWADARTEEEKVEMTRREMVSGRRFILMWGRR